MLTKEDILEEIRRTAKENSGIPFGRKRFVKHTGITEWELYKYWPRFSDALSEAGFKPNAYNVAFNDEYIFEKFISLTKQLGKIPVGGDLRVKRHSDSNFPTVGVFGRFGTKEQFLAKLLKYAESKEYRDVANLYQEALEKVNGMVSQENKIVEEIGSVYLAKSGKYYKIGRTNSMGRRHHEINILLPENFMLIHEIKTMILAG